MLVKLVGAGLLAGVLLVTWTTVEALPVDADVEANDSAEPQDAAGLWMVEAVKRDTNRLYGLHPALRYRWPAALRRAYLEGLRVPPMLVNKRYAYALDEPPEPNEFLGK
ncbi:uncharacterized protein LOC129584783 [Paramacrobiotus metropolitanus]|uniref:uncharacterized protein LOC129584783 n=1 Tax=Paramacrobiotus metropolitanus TaxID=2943436 RepID=UPI002445F8DE|nr:uncharacterized protein LOC129584783 [Paramacrobiotus metropolitanus]